MASAALEAPADDAGPRRGGGWAAALIGLIGVAVTLNYVDRGAMSVAAPLLKGELHLSATRFGLASSAFFWTYVPCHLAIGWLCDRVPVTRLMALGLALWAVATVLTGFVGGFAGLVVLRLLLGVGESVAFPGAAKLIAMHAPAERRGIANSMIGVGLAFGPAIGTLGGGMILAHWGWRPVFVLFGAVTLAWLVPWALAVRRVGPGHPAAASPAIPAARLLREPALWASSFAQFCTNWGLYFTLTWLPLFLVQQRGLPLATMAVMAGATYCANGIVSFVAGCWSDRVVARGVDEPRLRRWLVAASQFGYAAGILGMALTSGPAMLWACLLLSGAAAGLAYPNINCIAQIFAGPRAAGSWIGMQNGVANLAGVVGPTVVGIIIDATGSFTSAFVLSTAIAIVAALSWLVLVPRIERVIEQA